MVIVLFIQKPFSNGPPNGEDREGYETHVAGIIASSDDQFTGVAPGSEIISLKVFDPDKVVEEEALQWCVANAEEYSIDAVNLSLGWPGDFFTTDKSYWLDYYGLVMNFLL